MKSYQLHTLDIYYFEWFDCYEFIDFYFIDCQVLLIKYGFLFVFKYLNSSYGDIMIKGTILKQPTVDRDGGANHHDDYTVDCVYRSSLSETLNA